MKEKELLKYIIAFTIGDSYLRNTYQNPNLNSYYKCTVKAEHKDFIDFQYNILKNINSISYIQDNRIGKNNMIGIRTKVNPIYTKVRNRLYNVDGKRVLDPHYLKLIDDESLALIYMADGCLKKTPRKTKKEYMEVKLSTHSYSYFDNLALSTYIREKFNISFKVQQDFDNNTFYYYLICRQDEAEKFLKLTEPFKLKSFNYKWVRETNNEQPKCTVCGKPTDRKHAYQNVYVCIDCSH